jgi:hypothetical protein
MFGRGVHPLERGAHAPGLETYAAPCACFGLLLMERGFLPASGTRAARQTVCEARRHARHGFPTPNRIARRHRSLPAEMQLP